MPGATVAADALRACAPSRAVRVALPGAVAAAHAAQLVRDDERPFALVGRWGGAPAVGGSAPLRGAGAGEAPLALRGGAPPVTGDVPGGFVGGGWFGVLGYGLG